MSKASQKAKHEAKQDQAKTEPSDLPSDGMLPAEPNTELAAAADSVDAELFGDLVNEQGLMHAPAAELATMPAELAKPSDGMLPAEHAMTGTERVETVHNEPPAELDDRPSDRFEEPDLTEEQWARIRTASVAAIELALMDSEQMPAKWRDAFVGELKRRAEQEQLRNALEISAAAPTSLYRVVKSCMVNSNGMLTTLAAGSVVSAATHDLDKLRNEFGAELAPIKGTQIETREDQFGRQVSTVR